MSIIGALDVPSSAFERASFFWWRFFNIIPLNPKTLSRAPVGTDWRKRRMTLEELSETFSDGRYEVGLGSSCGVIVVEAPDPIFSWVHRTLGLPFAVTERFGLYPSFYRYDGTPFENPLHPAVDAAIGIHYGGSVIAPGTPQPGRKTLLLRNGGAHFQPWWAFELQREADAWKRARRQAEAIHAANRRSA
jgi:hypothetical protein